MKLLVFAHVPPPHHGQSFMVQQLIEGLGGAGEIELFHVDARLSKSHDDIGAAFAFHSGELGQSPAFTQWRGLEWLYRL